jgi:hypothetical protein
MDLETFNQTVNRSQSYDWERVDGGTTYTDSFSASMRGGSDAVELDVDYHHSRAVLRSDIDIAMAWGRDPNRHGSFDRGIKLSFSWQKNFPDPEVRALEVDLFYRGSLVRRETLLSIDGGRGLIPFGRTRKKDGAGMTSRNADDYYDACTQAEVDFAKLIDRIENHHSDFDSHLRQAGFVVEP